MLKTKPRTTKKSVLLNRGTLADIIAAHLYAVSALNDNVEVVGIELPEISKSTDNLVEIVLITKKEVYKTKSYGKGG